MQTARAVMSTSVQSVSPEQSLLTAYNLMYINRIRHLPVIDNTGTAVGMLSDRDIQRAMIVSQGDGDEMYLSSSKTVGDFMSVPLFSVRPEMPVSLLIDEFLKKKVSAVVVLDDARKCVGIITDYDLLTLLRRNIERDEELSVKPLSFFFPNTLY